MADIFLNPGESIPDTLITKFIDFGTHFVPAIAGGQEYFDQVAAGLVPGEASDDKFGHNPDIDSGTVEDVWDGGGIWAQPTVARIHNLASTDVNDTLLGTGARQVTVFGLDGSYVLQSENVDLDGTSDAPTANSYIMIYRLRVIAAGSGGANAGTITATAVTDATVTAQILVGKNQTLMAIFQVPAATTLSLYSYFGSILKETSSGAANFSLLVKPFGEVWQTRHTRSVHTSGTSDLRHTFMFPKIYSAKTLVKIGNVDVTANNTAFSAGFEFVLRS